MQRMRIAHAHGPCAWLVDSVLAKCSAQTWSCAAGQKVITRAVEGDEVTPPKPRSRCVLCGQPVQNLCLPWAQYMGFATNETQATFLARIMVKAAADILVIH
jgi:hypothetical protein